MVKIVVLDGYAANPGDLSWERLAGMGELRVYDRTSPADVVERACGADIVITNKVAVTDSLMERLPRLRYIGVTATGYNIIDVEAAHRRGITVTNIPAYSTMSVAQMVMAHLLNITNRVDLHARSVAAGEWERCVDFCYWKQPVMELDGRTFGIVGLGHTGMATARMAQSMGMRVLAYTSKDVETLRQLGIEKAVDYDSLFAASDVLSLHCPLTGETRHLVDARRLALMKPGSIVINTGRGALVDEQALADALNGGRLMAAGVDVLESEPPVNGSPLIGARNCFITPHIAWASLAARKRLLDITADNVQAFLSGEARNVV